MRIGIAFAPAPGAGIVSAHKFLQSFQLAAVIYNFAISMCRVTAARIFILHACPMINNVVQNCFPLSFVCGCGILFNQSFQCTAFIQRHGNLQRMHIAETGHIRQGFDVVGNGDVRRIHAVCSVGFKPDVCYVGSCSVRFGYGRCLQMGVPVGVISGLRLIIEVKAGYSCLFHSQQFPLIDNAIRIAVFPNFYFVPCSIVLVKNVVLVAVEIF